ncbi:hypothetical protein D9M71_548210 [compost metagenome]
MPAQLLSRREALQVEGGQWIGVAIERFQVQHILDERQDFIRFIDRPDRMVERNIGVGNGVFGRGHQASQRMLRINAFVLRFEINRVVLAKTKHARV